MSIAEVLGSYSEFVGESEAHCLLVPLELLCHVEESTVRDMAVQSINAIGKVLPATQLYEHLVPIAMKLSKNTDWFTPRVSACGICALAYTATARVLESGGGAEVGERAKELRDIFCKHLGIDESPMVRRAAASRLAEYAEAFGRTHTEEELLPLYRTLLADEQESVRVNALGCTAAVCDHISHAEKVAVLSTEFSTAVADKSWRVRVCCAEKFAKIAAVCRKDGPLTAETEALVGMLQEVYVRLQGDHEVEVRTEAAMHGAEVVQPLGAEFGANTVFPVVSKFALDENHNQRRQLATVLMEMCEPLGKEYTLQLIHPVMLQLIEDSVTDVRLSAINHLSQYIDVVGLDDGDGNKWQGASLISLLGRLLDPATEKNWRVRLIILHMMPKLSKLAPDCMASLFGLDAMDKKAQDGCSLIRHSWVDAVAQTAAQNEGGKHKWLEEFVVPVLEKQALEEKNYLQQVVLAYGLEQLAQHLPMPVVEGNLLPKCIALMASKVPNLRIQLASTFEAVARVVGGGARSNLQAKLQELTVDADVDVKEAAEASMGRLEAERVF